MRVYVWCVLFKYILEFGTLVETIRHAMFRRTFVLFLSFNIPFARFPAVFLFTFDRYLYQYLLGRICVQFSFEKRK